MPVRAPPFRCSDQDASVTTCFRSSIPLLHDTRRNVADSQHIIELVYEYYGD